MIALRQVVLLAADLTDTIDHLRTGLRLHAGVRDEAGMASLGFEHEVLAIDETFVEVVSPLRADSSPARLLARRGDCGYMVVLQVPALDAVLDRAAALGLAPVMHTAYAGNPISQWHPRDLGTLVEIDEIADGEPWHLCPQLSDTGSTVVARDIVAVTVAVPDPAASARRWAALLGFDPPEASLLTLEVGQVQFVVGNGGLVQVRLAASGRAPISFMAGGVRFTVEPDGRAGDDHDTEAVG